MSDDILNETGCFTYGLLGAASVVFAVVMIVGEHLGWFQ